MIKGGHQLPTIIDNFKAGLLVGRLLGVETGGKRGLVGGGDQYAAAGVFGLGAAMNTNACAAGDLLEDGKEAVELGAFGDRHLIDQRGDEVVSVLEGVADEVQALGGLAGTEVVVVRGAEKLAVHGAADLVMTDEFVKHKDIYHFIIYHLVIYLAIWLLGYFLVR